MIYSKYVYIYIYIEKINLGESEEICLLKNI
jgi:hypothetical protein